MSDKCSQNISPIEALKNESARQRWELFHRAVAYAKQSNNQAQQDSEASSAEPKRGRPNLSIAQ
jgi:hypothetical protein